jgi:hypothetical protein
VSTEPLPEYPQERPFRARPPRTFLGTLVALLGGLIGVVYVLNPTAGLFELVPDITPVVGNLDEAGATVLAMASLRYLFKGPPPREGA